MKLLAVETATEACSAALFIDGDIRERYALAPREHTKLILPMLDDLLREADIKLSDLNALAFGCGPGSFTGIRIATGVIQGVALGADLPVVPVSTLAAMADAFFQNSSENTAFVALDARISEIFWGVYQRDAENFAQLIGAESVIAASAVDFPEAYGVGIGSGWGVYTDALLERAAGRVSRYEAAHLPRASAIARLGAIGFQRGLAVAAEHAMPVYLRDKVAQTEAERRQQTR